ncbi:MAG: hypothetical protein J5947_07740 [Clostridium sp.]|nr:hypothetical protein [Clostridium sp.]
MKIALLLLLALFMVQPISGCSDTASEAVTAVSEAASAAESLGNSAEEIVNMLPEEVKSKADQVSATFVGFEKQPYKDEAGKESKLNTVWIYYKDLHFEQYAFVDGAMQLFSTGNYELSDGAHFEFGPDDKDVGEITITRTKKYQAGKGLSDYSSTHTYELNTLGFTLYK